MTSAAQELGKTMQGGVSLISAIWDFPASFPIDILGKLVRKAANGYHMIAEQCTNHKYELVAKHPDRNHLTAKVPGQMKLQGWIVRFIGSVPQ